MLLFHAFFFRKFYTCLVFSFVVNLSFVYQFIVPSTTQFCVFSYSYVWEFHLVKIEKKDDESIRV